MYQGERFNSISHLFGAITALAGLVIVVVFAAKQGDPWKIVSLSVYGTTLFSLYTISTLYHSLRGQAKLLFRKLDHYSIYFLIAGTYTAFTLVTLRGGWGWTIFGLIWGLAALGILLEFLPQGKNRILSVIIYGLLSQIGAKKSKNWGPEAWQAIQWLMYRQPQVLEFEPGQRQGRLLPSLRHRHFQARHVLLGLSRPRSAQRAWP